MSNIFLQAALEYLKRGWHVLPARGKKVIIKWAKYQKTGVTEADVRDWWGRWPDANIALMTGRISGVVVVDYDMDKGADPREDMEKYPTKLVSKTRNGYHLFYSYPHGASKVDCSTSPEGVDVRGDGGIIILPPSRHPDDKRVFYHFTSDGGMGSCPDVVLDPPRQEKEEQGPNREKWLVDLLLGQSKGSRNDSCARIAGYFAGKGVVRDVAMVSIQQWNERNNPPLPWNEIDTTVRSVYRTAYRNTPTPKPNGKGHDGVKAFSMVTFDAYMVEHGNAAVEWAIDDWLPAQTVAFVISPPGSYKTWMVLDLALSIATGVDFLGKFKVADPGPVIIMQQEDFHGQIAERLATIYQSKETFSVADIDDPDEFECVVPPSNIPIHIHPDRMFRFNDEVVCQALEQHIAAIRPKLVILDPLYSAGSTDDYMAKTAEQMFFFKRLRDTYGCSFLIVHHTKKGAEGSERERLWGSQFLNAFLETGWQIRPVEGEEAAVMVRRHFKVKSNPTEIFAKFSIKTDMPPKYEVRVDEADYESDSDVEGLLKKSGPLTMNEIADKLKVHRSTISRKVAPLIKLGTIIKAPDGSLSWQEPLEF